LLIVLIGFVLILSRTLFFQAIVQGLQEAGVFSNAVQAGQARLEKSLQQENAALKRASSVKVDTKQTALESDTSGTEAEEVKGANIVAAMPPRAPPGLELLRSELPKNSTGSL
jgi:hypothetical protein